MSTSHHLKPVSPVLLSLPLDVSVPNNELPVVLYPKVSGDRDLETVFRTAFHSHSWRGIWADGVFGYHHFHSNAHEVMGVLEGEATLMLGGEEGRVIDLCPGDVLVLPAGTGHRRMRASPGFQVLGAYPKGQETYDVYTPALDFANARARIRAVPLPREDPVYGPDGPLLRAWGQVHAVSSP
jgi:uncharacterized protein YjlB